MTKPKIKIKFAPGAFDTFEGSQEELDSLVKEIVSKLSTMTQEELLAGASFDADDLDCTYFSQPTRTLQ